MARDFNNTSDHIDLDGRFTTSVDDWSIFAWVNVTLAQQTGCVAYNGSDSNGWGLFVGDAFDGTNSKIVGLFGGVTWVNQDITFTSDTWTSIGLLRRSGTAYIIKDGAETSSVANTPNAPGDLASIGQQWSNDAKASESRYVDGTIAELAVWEVALTAAEHGSLADGFSPLLIRPASLAYYCPLIGNRSTEVDVIGGNAGTIDGTTKTAHPRVISPTIQPYRIEPSGVSTVVQDILGSGFIPYER